MIIYINICNFKMSFSLKDVKEIGNIFDNIKHFSESIKMCFNTKQLHIQAIDDAKVSIIDIVINSDYFDSFTIDKEYNMDFNITNFCKIFKIITKSRYSTFKLKNNSIKITAEESDTDIKKTFVINSNINTQNIIQINNIKINNSIEINSKNLNQLFNDLFQFSDEINIKLNKSGLYFNCNNEEINSQFKLSNNNHNKYEIESEIDLNFSVKYLAKYKIYCISDTSVIKFENNKPLILHTKKTNITTNFIISPMFKDF